MDEPRKDDRTGPASEPDTDLTIRWAWAVSVALAYGILAFVSLQIAKGTGGFAVAWPASGVFAAALLRFTNPTRFVTTACVVAASIAANLAGGTPLADALSYTVANVIEGYIVLVLMGARTARERRLSRPADLVRFAGAAIVAGLSSAVIAGTLTGAMTDAFLASWGSTVSLGLLIMTPLILFLVEDRAGRRRLASPRAILVSLAVLVTCLGAFGQTQQPLLFVPFIAVSLATTLLGLSGTAVAVGIVTLCGSVLLIGSDGLLGRFYPAITTQIWFFQIYLVALITSSLPIAVLLAQRDKTLRQLARVNAQVAKEAKDARALSETDPLTGLANRRRVLADLAIAMDEAAASGGLLCVGMIDVDRFKSINDGFGHDMGDHVLRELAGRLAASLAVGERIGRLGGEEFLVIIPHAEPAALVERCAMLRDRIAEVQWPAGGPERVTLSIGIAQWRQGWGEADLLTAADQALYRAKAEGRDRCVVHSGPVCTPSPA